MPDSPDYRLNISKLEDESDTTGSSPARGRKWIGMYFECCSMYQRIYRNREGTAYHGNCPRCQKPIHIKVGPGGTNDRMFRAT